MMENKKKYWTCLLNLKSYPVTCTAKQLNSRTGVTENGCHREIGRYTKQIILPLIFGIGKIFL